MVIFQRSVVDERLGGDALLDGKRRVRVFGDVVDKETFDAALADGQTDKRRRKVSEVLLGHVLPCGAGDYAIVTRNLFRLMVSWLRQSGRYDNVGIHTHVLKLSKM